jgi:DNA-binding SARP family transcriptional activator
MARVLGPVDVLLAGRPTGLGGRLERTLFAALALSANHAVSADQLAAILWQAAPPPSRDNTLQTYVSRLRHLVGHDRIRSVDHSYVLEVAPAEVDAVIFERLASEAASDRAEASRCLELATDALDLWRGVPFGELAEFDPFRLEAIRLDEIRLFVVELRLASEIALGREDLVVGALEALADEYPYRERIWHLLISALALCGRRTEALRSYQDLRGRLGEIGLQPIPELRLLEQVIINENGDPRLGVHPPPGRR